MLAEHDNDAPARQAPEPHRYTPPAMSHAERVALQLHERYRRKTLSDCRHAAARMYGYADWTALEAAVAAGAEPACPDEDLEEVLVRVRRERQRDIALVWLAGVDDDTARAAQVLEQALLTQAPHTISQRYDPLYNRKRLDRARYAYNLAYAGRVVVEVRPTALQPLDIPRDDPEIELGLRVDLLPRALKLWLAQHRPLLERWSCMIGAMRVRQRCATELLDFSYAWGELCLLHGVTIPKSLQVYPIALCAQWYGWLACLDDPALRDELALLERAGAHDPRRERAQQVVTSAIRREEERFMLAQPREDFRSLSRSAREQQMNAGHAAVRRYMAEAASEHTIKSILTRPSWLSVAPAPG